jgi:hypothetical protein
MIVSNWVVESCMKSLTKNGQLIFGLSVNNTVIYQVMTEDQKRINQDFEAYLKTVQK